jgi:hypothetical protein
MVEKMSYTIALFFLDITYYFLMDGVVCPQLVTKVAFNMVVNILKEECEGAT